MKIVILGADGYLGWPTAMHFAALGHEVVVTDNYMKRRIMEEVGASPLIELGRLPERAQAFREQTGHTIKVVDCDVASFEQLSSLVESEVPDAIVHYAEQPSGPYSMIGHAEADLTLKNNVGGTLALAHAVLAHAPDCHIVKLGTMGEYGTPDTEIPDGWLEFEYRGRKDTRLFPREAGSLYHTTKILDTDVLWFYCRMKGLRVTDLMQGPVYGMLTEEMNGNTALGTHFYYDACFGTAINRFVTQAAVGHPLTVYGKGEQVRGYLHIEDTLQCVRLAVNTPVEPGELRVLNQFTEEFSVNTLAERVAEAGRAMGLEVNIDHLDNPRKEKEQHFYKASRDAFDALGLKPHLLSEDDLKGMIEAVQRNAEAVDHRQIAPSIRW